MPVIGIVLIADHLVQRFAELDAGARKETRKISEARDSILGGGGVAGVQNHAGRQRCCAVFPMPLHRAVLATPNDHVRDVLSVGNVARGEQANLGERIETG